MFNVLFISSIINMLTNNKSAKLGVAELFRMNQLLFFPLTLDRWQAAGAVADHVDTPKPGLSEEDEDASGLRLSSPETCLGRDESGM